MANPFLVLGGVAVGIVVAAAGVLMVPGWLASAQDAAALNDLSHVAAGEAAAVTAVGKGYMSGAELTANADKLGMSFQLSGGVKLCVTRSTDAKDYAGVALSASGAYFARTPGHAKAQKGATPAAALDAVGGLPAGVPDPIIDGDCAPGAEIISGIEAGGPGEGGSVIPPQALGEQRELNWATPVAYTSYGVMTIQQDGVIMRSADDGTAHVFEARDSVSGDPVTFAYYSGMSSDAAGNLYAISNPVAQDSGGHWSGVQDRRLPYKIAPDGTATQLWHAGATYNGGYWPPSSIAATPNGTVYVGMNGWGDGEYPETGIYTLKNDIFTLVASTGGAPGSMSADAAGNVYFGGWPSDCEGLCQVTPTGQRRTVATAEQLGGGSPSIFTSLADGTIVYNGYSNSSEIRKLAPNGTDTLIATSEWGGDVFFGGMQGMAADPDGAVYYSEFSGTSNVYKLGITGTPKAVLMMH